MKEHRTDRNVRRLSSASTRIAAAAALGAGAASAQGAIQFYNLDITLNDGDVWFLEGLGGSTALANVSITSTFYTTTYTTTVSTPTYGSTYTTTYTYTLSYELGSFPSLPYNGFRFADEGFESPRALNTTQSVSAPLFTGGGDGISVSWSGGGTGSNAQADWDNWTIGTEQYAGFRFTHPTDGQVYGWVKVTIEPEFNGVRLNTWAYEDSGDPIRVGAQVVPEPSTLGLGALAAGIVGMRAYRRRRKNAAEQESA